MHAKPGRLIKQIITPADKCCQALHLQERSIVGCWTRWDRACVCSPAYRKGAQTMLVVMMIFPLYRPDLEAMLEDYWKLMPVYQGVNLMDLEPLRILFGFFPTYRCDKTAFWCSTLDTLLDPADWLPCFPISSISQQQRRGQFCVLLLCIVWHLKQAMHILTSFYDCISLALSNSAAHICVEHCRDSPLTPQLDRILQIGDASGIQSPLSFGGFGALSRHLPRLKAAIVEALNVSKFWLPFILAPCEHGNGHLVMKPEHDSSQRIVVSDFIQNTRWYNDDTRHVRPEHTQLNQSICSMSPIHHWDHDTYLAGHNT